MKRNTAQRAVVIESLFELANHPTAEEVYNLAAVKQPHISKATVYRILSDLADTGEALRVRINNGADHFDHNAFPHHHVRCLECGCVDDVMLASPADIESRAAKASGYQIKAHNIQFDGICPRCQAKKLQEA